MSDSNPTTPHVADLRALPDPADSRATAEAILFEIRRVIVGQDAMLERILVGLLSGGHLLLEGVPGLAKTLTIKTLADVLGGSFKRIQFTPDLMPSDLVGTRIFRPDRGGFEVEPGPVFANFLLADEINRAPAKVQSALLEVMQEHQVTIGHETFKVPVAVPGPRDREPDRGRGHVSAARGPGRPVHARRSCSTTRTPRDEAQIVARSLSPAADAARGPRCRQVFFGSSRPSPRSTSTRASSATRSRSSRPPAGSRTGAHPSSRATSRTAPAREARSTSIHGARAMALLHGRRYVLPNDIIALAPDVLRHRLVMSYAALADGVTADSVVSKVITLVPAPRLEMAVEPTA